MEAYETISAALVDAAGSKENFDLRVRGVIEQTIDWLLDEGETIDDLEGSEKTMFGTRFEKRLTKTLGLPCKRRKTRKGEPKTLDTKIAGHDVDIKCTLGGKSWMIPREAINHYCLLVKVDYRKSRYDIGLFHAVPENLTISTNQDKKFSTAAYGKQTINWLASAQAFDLPYRAAAQPAMEG